MENNFQNGWVETTLNEIADWGSGGTPKSSEPKYYDGDIPWLIIADLNDGEITTSQKRITKLGLENSSARIVPVNSVLCAMYGSIGKLGIAKIPCATNQAIAFTHKIHGKIPYMFLFYYLFSLKKYLLEIGKGGAQQNISQSVLKEVSFLIPPLPEQQRIVSKLNGVMQKVESNKQRLEKIPKLLKRFRLSVLAAAVNGKLTEAWRTENGIDEEWEYMKATDACETVASGSTPKNNPFYEKEEIPYLKVYNIVNQKIDFFYKPQYIKRAIHEKELKRCKVYPNDVLINIVGPPLGKVALMPDTFPEWNINQAIVVFRPKEFLSPIFLYYILCDGKQIKDIELELRGTAGQLNISLTQCRNFDFPIPKPQEQKEIIRRVEKLFAFADKLEARYTKAKTMIDKLPQSILAKAFRGELVPQNPNDEPASVLLERIKKEKEKLIKGNLSANKAVKKKKVKAE